MTNLLNGCLVLLMMTNLLLLGTGRIAGVLQVVAWQGVLLGILPLLMHHHLALPTMLMALAAIVLKGMVIPAIMLRALEKAQIKREVEPLVGLLPSILLGAGATAFALLLADQLPLIPEHEGTLLVPAALATMLVGFLLLTTRVKAITQVIGYLVLENGIFVFGILLLEAMPLIVEMGILLDLVVGIFVISILTQHINQAFSSMDTRRLISLRE